MASRARATAEALLLGSFDHLGENVAKVLPGWTKAGRLKPVPLTLTPEILNPVHFARVFDGCKGSRSENDAPAWEC